MICTKCNHNPCSCVQFETVVESTDLYTKKALHIGYPFMLGRIIKCEFHKLFYLVTIRYEEKDIDDKVFRVFKTEEIGATLCQRIN